MRRKSVKPSQYPPLPFHAIRTIVFISAVIVAIILSVFIYNLHTASLKLPWAFLVLIISAFVTILTVTVTTAIHCCYGLSPRLSLITTSTSLTLWLVSLALLSWSLSHTILTTCNATYWATSTGIAVCRIYKALFAFTVLTTIAHIAALTLDIIVHRRATRLGEYDPMAPLDHRQGQGHDLAEYKTQSQSQPHHERNSSVLSASLSPYYPHPTTDDDRSPLVQAQPQYHHARHRSDSEDITDGGGGPFAPPPYSTSAGTSAAANSGLEQYHVGDTGERGRPRMRLSVYDNAYGGYGQHSEQTGYDPLAYR